MIFALKTFFSVISFIFCQPKTFFIGFFGDHFASFLNCRRVKGAEMFLRPPLLCHTKPSLKTNIHFSFPQVQRQPVKRSEVLARLTSVLAPFTSTDRDTRKLM